MIANGGFRFSFDVGSVVVDQVWIEDSKRENLPRILRQLGLSQKQLAAALEISATAISRFLSPGPERLDLRENSLRRLVVVLTQRLAELRAIKVFGPDEMDAKRREGSNESDRLRSRMTVEIALGLTAQTIRRLEGEIAELLEPKPSIELPAIPHVEHLDFPEASIGRRMQTGFIAVPPGWNVGRTIEYMQTSANLPERFFELYVADPQGKFLGALPLDRLMRTRREIDVSSLMEPERHVVHARDDQEEVTRRFERYNLVAAPVLDEHERIVGVITFDDIVDVIEQEAEEDIAALLERDERELEKSVGPNQRIEPSSIPERRRAAVEPLWDRNVLTISMGPVPTDQDEIGFVSALRGLRNVMRNFTDEISGEANIDRRFVSFVRHLADQIPEGAPPQHELFEIGHVEAVFAEYTRTVNDQWPNFLAARYHAIVLQFDRTMRQSEAWRDFKRNAAEATFTDVQTREAAQLANAAVVTLRNDEAANFVDQLVPQVLERLADPRSRWPDDALAEIEAGKEELAADLIESTNNIFKAVAEAALPVVIEAAATVRQTTGKTAAAFWQEFEKGAVAEAKAQGKPAGRAAVRWLLRFAKVTGGAAGVGGVGVGAYAGFSKLMTQYPEAFGWLQQLLRFFQQALPPL